MVAGKHFSVFLKECDVSICRTTGRLCAPPKH